MLVTFAGRRVVNLNAKVGEKLPKYMTSVLPPVGAELPPVGAELPPPTSLRLRQLHLSPRLANTCKAVAQPCSMITGEGVAQPCSVDLRSGPQLFTSF